VGTRVFDGVLVHGGTGSALTTGKICTMDDPGGTKRIFLSGKKIDAQHTVIMGLNLPANLKVKDKEDGLPGREFRQARRVDGNRGKSGSPGFIIQSVRIPRPDHACSRIVER